MPSRAPAACKRSGCAGLVVNGVCSKCGPLRRRTDSVVDEQRGTAAERGYGRRWRTVRAMYLRQHPVCDECLRYGRVKSATDVHHKIPKRDGGTDEDGNLQALCHECHSRITGKGG